MLTTLLNTLQILGIVPILGFILGLIEKLLIYIFTKGLGSKAALFIMNKLSFIGVVHHELSHAFFGFITGAKIKSMNLFKPQNGTLGSVEIIPRGNSIFQSIQLTLTAIAPVVTGIISMSTILWIITSNSDKLKIWQLVILAYLFISILVHSTMSTADLKCALRGLPIFAIITFIIVYITKFNLIKFIGGMIK